MTKRFPTPPRASHRYRWSRRALFLCALPAAAACDVPTGLPEWEATWVVPADSVTIALESFLPAGVAVVDGPAFQLELAPVTGSRTLAEACGEACSGLDGAEAPKPAFKISVQAPIALPAEVVSAAVEGGTIRVEASHDLGFDPLRPAETVRGYLVVTARLGPETLVRDSVDGATTAFPAGSPLTVDLRLPSARLDGPIDLQVTLFSPEGDSVTVETGQRFTVSATADSVRVSEVVVVAAGREVTSGPVELDLSDIDATLVNRLRRGALRLQISNPLAAGGPLALRVTTPTRTIEKASTLATGTSEVRVEFTEEELRAMLGANPVTLEVTGSVTGEGGVLALRPGQDVVVQSRLELVLVPLEAD